MWVGGERSPGDKPKCIPKLVCTESFVNRKMSGKIRLCGMGMYQVWRGQSRIVGHPAYDGDSGGLCSTFLLQVDTTAT